MQRKPVVILPLASALGALAGSSLVAAEAKPVANADMATSSQAASAQSEQKPTMLASTGDALLGFVTTEQADGRVVAQHASHVSHASHASHASSR